MNELKEERKRLAIESRLQKKLIRSRYYAASPDAKAGLQSHLDEKTKREARVNHLAYTFLRGKIRSYCEPTRREEYCSSVLSFLVGEKVFQHMINYPRFLESYQHMNPSRATIHDAVRMWMTT